MNRIDAHLLGMTVESPAASRGRRGAATRLLGVLVRLMRRRFRRIVTDAIAVTPRGFVARDALCLTRLSAELQMEWRTRDIHPWDRHVGAERRDQLICQQALRDTDEAILRCFAMLPDVVAITVRVLEPHPPNRLICAGRVVREDAVAACAFASPRMRLELMGIRCLANDGRLTALE